MTDNTPGQAWTLDDDWWAVLQCLPRGWMEQARNTGAIRRARAFRDPQLLLRALMIHLAEGCSLRETAVRARASGLANVSDVALMKRLRASEEWLRWMCRQMVEEHRLLVLPTRSFGTEMRIRLADATAVSEPGSTGTDWRLHYAVELRTLQCDFFEVTDVRGGESYRRIPVVGGDLVLGDRIYATKEGVRHVVEHGGHVLVRMRVGGLCCRTADDRPFPLFSRLKTIRIGQVGEWDAWVVTRDGTRIQRRICAIRRSRAAAGLAERRLRRKCQRKCRTPGSRSLLAAKYVFVFTTLPATLVGAREALDLYRARWQVELVFKRLKSVLGFGHLPKYDQTSSRAWLHGKLLVALIAERLVAMARAFSPWGYQIPETCAAHA